MVYESKRHISIGFSEPRHLVFPIENWCGLNSVSLNVKYGSVAHQESYHESQDGRHNLEDFSVFDVAKTEIYREEAKDEDSQIVWIKTQLFLELSFVAPNRVGNAEYKAFGTTDVFEANRSVHIKCQNSDNAVLDPAGCDRVGYDAQLDLLANVKWTSLIVNIF